MLVVLHDAEGDRLISASSLPIAAMAWFFIVVLRKMEAVCCFGRYHFMAYERWGDGGLVFEPMRALAGNALDSLRGSY